MSKKVAGFLLAGWVLFGLTIFFLFIGRDKTNHRDQILQELKQLNTKIVTNDHLLKILPSFFDKEPGLAAIFLIRNGTVRGSLYEPDRFDSAKINQVIRDYKSKRAPTSIPQYSVIQIKNQNRRILLYLKKNPGFVALQSHMNSRYPQWKVYLTGYLGAGLLIFLFFLFGTSDRTQPVPIRSQSTAPGPAKSSDVAPIAEIPAEHTIRRFLDNLSSLTHPKRVVWMTMEQNQWHPVFEKRGSLYIMGESIRVPSFVRKMGNLHAPIKTPGAEITLHPVTDGENTVGLVFLENGPESTPDALESQEGQALISAFARNLKTQSLYENAIYDEQTGLYTYPGFYFSLRERITGEIPFYSVIFSLNAPEFANPENLRRWGDFGNQLMKENPGLLFARLNDHSFGILFSQHDSLEEVMRICAELEKYTYSIFSRSAEFYGGIVPPDEGISDHKTYMKRLEATLADAKAQKSWGVVIDKTLRTVA